MKTRNQYQPHDADNLDTAWDAVDEYAKDAILAAWDGCHKIYLAMDEYEADWFRKEYAEHIAEASDADLVETIVDWYEESCSLRFISAVWHNEADPNNGFVTLISQFAEFADADDDDFDDLHPNGCRNCGEKYAVGGCPACGEGGY